MDLERKRKRAREQARRKREKIKKGEDAKGKMGTDTVRFLLSCRYEGIEML